MKRKPKETKKERKQRLSQTKHNVSRQGAALSLVDTSYVETMMRADAVRLLKSTEMISDPRVNIWLIQLDRRLDLLTKGSPISRQQANRILSLVNNWENANAGKFKSKSEATTSIARMLDHIVSTMPKTKGPVQRKVVHAEAETIGRIVDTIQEAKCNFVDTAMRVALPEGQAAVSSYLYCSKKLMEGTQGVVRDIENRGAQAGIELARHIWAHLRNARVFEIPAGVWQSLHRIHEQHFMAAVAAQKVPEDQAFDFLKAHAQMQPFPENLPFEYTYIGLGAGVMLDLKLARIRVGQTVSPDTVVGVNMLGYLICGPSQQAYEMLHILTEDADYFLPLAQRYDGTWPFGETLAAWLIAEMVNLINEHNTVVLNHEPSGKMREDFRKVGGKGAPGFLPQPYYTVRLKHKVIDESELDRTKESGFGRVLSYRYDRRGHERCYIERGTLPIAEKTERKLLKYGYRFIVGKPDGDDAARLAYRAIPPKRSDEWLAIKVRWIEDVVVGDEKLPYIPAVRVPEQREADPTTQSRLV
jgi:hypothetical protein